MAAEPVNETPGAFTTGREPFDVNRDFAVVRCNRGEGNQMMDDERLTWRRSGGNPSPLCMVVRFEGRYVQFNWFSFHPKPALARDAPALMR